MFGVRILTGQYAVRIVEEVIRWELGEWKLKTQMAARHAQDVQPILEHAIQNLVQVSSLLAMDVFDGAQFL